MKKQLWKLCQLRFNEKKNVRTLHEMVNQWPDFQVLPGHGSEEHPFSLLRQT